MTTLTFQKFQPRTKRGIAKSCQVCNKPFSVLSMDYEHQCKRCIRAICKQCGKVKRDVYKLGKIKNPHRLCSICTKQSDFIREYIQANQLKFGKDSDICKKWVSKLPDDDYQVQEDKGDDQQIQNKFVFALFEQMWDSYNYSMRQFVGLLTFDINQRQVFKCVNAVYQQLLDTGYDQKIGNIMYLIVFVLCFASPQSAFRIIQRLINLRQTVTDSRLLLQAYLKGLRVEQSQIKKISEYINYKIKNFMGAVSINSISVECSIHIISRIIEKGKIQQAFMILALVFDENLQYLIKNKDLRFECDLEIIRNCKLEKYLQKYRQISNIKTNQFIKIKPKSVIEKLKNQQQSPSQQSMYQKSNSYIFQQSPRKRSGQMSQYNQDSLSSKTRSIRDESMREHVDTTSQYTQRTQRKTQKPLLMPKFGGNQGNQYTTSFSTNFVKESCDQCERNCKKIQDLQNKVRIKQRQIENLNFKLSFKRKQSNDDFGFGSENRMRNTTQQMIKQSEQVSKLELQMMNKSEQTIALFEQLTQVKKQNALFRVRLQQLQTNNKILRNNLSSSPNSLPNISIDTAREQQQNRVFGTLKKALQSKNKQLEQVMKRNKLLNYQIQQMQRQYAIQRPESNVGTRDQMMKKIAELTEKICQQQAQKLKMSQELFDLKEEYKSISSTSQKNQTKSNPISSIAPKAQCSTF